MNKLWFLLLCALLGTVAAPAQSDKQHVRKGNRFYNNQDYEKAASAYRNALEKNPLNDKATYNLGNAMYRQNHFEDALEQYKNTAEMSRDRSLESRALYNAGNSLIEARKYSESIPYYQKALRLDPNDEDARYNLAYALRMMQQEQQNKQNQDNQRDHQQQNDKNQQNNNDSQQNQNNPQKASDNQQQPPKNRQPQLSKEEAERLIQALTNEEKRTMDKVNQQKFKTGARMMREKDW